MKFNRNSIAATLTAVSLGAVIINPVSAGVSENGRVVTTTRAGFELTDDSPYTDGRTAPEGTRPVSTSTAGGKTNGRQG
jgi:hypothetical protein